MPMHVKKARIGLLHRGNAYGNPVMRHGFLGYLGGLKQGGIRGQCRRRNPAMESLRLTLKRCVVANRQQPCDIGVPVEVAKLLQGLTQC